MLKWKSNLDWRLPQRLYKTKVIIFDSEVYKALLIEQEVCKEHVQ